MDSPASRLASAVDAAPLMMWIGDATGALTFANRKWLSFTARESDEVLGNRWLASVHPDDRTALIDAHRAATRALRPLAVEFRLRRGDGAYRAISCTAVPLHDADGAFAGHIAACVDISERETGVLQRTLEHLRLVAANADEMIYRIKPSNPPVIEYMSPGVSRITGLSLEDFLRDPYASFDRVHPDDRPRLVAMLEAVPDPNVRVTIRWCHPDGKIVWAEHRRLPIYDAAGNLVAVDGVATDITRQKKLEQERDAQIALLDALIGHMHDGVLAETDDGSVAVVNAAFSRIFGLSADEIRANSESPIPRVRRMLADPASWNPRRSGGSGSENAELRLLDGRTIEHQYFPVRLDDGRVIHMWQFRDISARRQEEEELIASRHRLRDLSAHLESVREEERRALARELHDELGQLLTGVRLEVASAIEKFKTIQTAADFDVVDRLQGTVGLVDLSIATVRRITRALRPPMLDHLGLMATIRWEAALFERRTGIRCRVSSRPSTFETRAHVTVLYRILIEALTNVARHANAGTIWIHVRQRPDRLTMEVRDNGRGISNEAITSPATLGLLGMRERALAVGGDVRIVRVPTGGTNVIVTVPIEPAEQTAESAANA